MDIFDTMDRRWEQVIISLSILLIAFILGRIIRFILGRFIKASAKKLKVDPTRYNFFKNAVDFIIFLIATILIFRSIPSLRAFSTTLLTGAGVLAAIVGFASQSAFSNIISGIFLVIFRPFSVGDRVKIGQLYSGDVEDITLRHTVIKDFENRRIVIPNNVISNETIINSTIVDEKVIMFVEFTISFEAPVEEAITIIQEEAMKHPFFLDNRNADELQKGEHPVMVRIISILESGVLLRAYAWAKNPTEGFELKCDLHRSIKLRFDKARIEIPYPHRVILNKGITKL